MRDRRNPMIGLSFSVRTVRVIARNTVREAVRQRVLLFISLLALALVLGAQWLREFNFGASEVRFITDFGFGAMAFFGAALSIVATSQLFFSELDHRTVLTLLAKPVGRAEFLVGKYFGVAVITGLFCATLTMALTAVLLLRDSTLFHRTVPALPSSDSVIVFALWIAGFAQWLKLLVLSIFTLLVASFARSQLLATGVGFVLLVCGHLQFILQNTADRGGGGVTRVAAFLVSRLVPDFQLFDLSELADDAAGQWMQLVRLTSYAMIYVLAGAVVAVAVFRRREL
jgi:ABC-type transport system involved in multi-copper enzyme maturation permease subunit